VQEKKLQQNQEQEDHDGAVGIEEVLRFLPQASDASRNQVDWVVGCGL
jgi:hypothetical protein